MRTDQETIIAMHEDQQWGPYPYEVHLKLVSSLAYYLTESNRMLTLGLMHDLLEDTDLVPEDIPHEYRETLVLLARNYSQGERSYSEYIAMLRESDNQEAKVIKFCDSIVNLALCVHLGDEDRAKRYRQNVKCLWEAVFGDEHDEEVTTSLVESISFPDN